MAHHPPDKRPGQRVDALLAVLEGLEHLKSTPAKEKLIPFLSNPSPLVRQRVQQTLRALDPSWSPVDGPLIKTDAAWPPLEITPPKHVLVHTNRGNFRMELLHDTAPWTAANFLALVRKRYYDQLTFHRVIPDFVVQGGDPRGDGNGGPGYTILSEWTPSPFKRGVVGMAHAGKDTPGSQFFITHTRHPHLDGGYTVFARVTEGMEIVDALLPEDWIAKIVVQ